MFKAMDHLATRSDLNRSIAEFERRLIRRIYTLGFLFTAINVAAFALLTRL